MAKNFIQPGKTVTLNAPYARESGEGALKDSIFGVSLGKVAVSVDGEFGVTGVWDIAKTSAQAWTQGQRIHWDDTNKRCDSDATLGPLIGVASEAAANPSSTGKVRLNGGAPATTEGKQAALTVQKTTITHTAPGTEDFAIQGLTSTTPFGFVTADEGNTVLLVIANLQTRLAELETKLKAVGLLT